MSVIVDQVSVVPTALLMLAASLIMVIVGIAACFVPATGVEGPAYGGVE